MQLTILMPCLNEAETLQTCILKAHQSIEKLGLTGEVLIADNGSTDGSQALAESLGARVISVMEKGYGSALAGGIAAAQGEWIIMGDADDSYNFAEIAPFVDKLNEGYDLVMGCRMPRGGGKIIPGAMPWKHRWIGNPVLTFIGRLLFRCPSKDFHCGLRGFTKKAALRMELRTTGMEFASEMVIKASQGKMKIAEVPITLYKDGRSRPPHLRSWRDGWRHLRFMLLFSPRWLFFYPGLLLCIIGAAGFVSLILGPIQIGKINFDTNSLLVFAMGIQLGFQLIFFAAFARLYTAQVGLLPETKFIHHARALLSLEKVLIVGLLLFSSGMIILLRAVFLWANAGFGDLSYSSSMRIVITSFLLLTLGTQVSFGAFLLSTLGLKSQAQRYTPRD
jgi:glycosyltransferase involved in cell wall biosynthesis